MIDKNRLLTLFEQLISIDNPSFNERKICDFIKGILNDLKISFEEDDAASKIGGNCGNLYAYVDGEISLPPILFSAHMDSVNPAKGKKMKTDKNGIITSDGTTVLGADDCAGIAAILEALKVLKDSGKPHRPIEILFTVAEEPYCIGVRQFDLSKLRGKEAYVFDLSGPVGSAAYQAPTILSFKARFLGHASHAGFAPEEGIHAIKAASDAIAQIPCGHVGASTVNIGTVSGGSADNIVPDCCTVTGEIRSFSDSDAHLQLNKLSEIMHSSAERFGATVDMQSTVHCTAYCTSTEHSVVKRFESACKECGIEINLCQTFGGSDNNHLALNGMNGIVTATAMNNCHACNEYTTTQELERAAQLALALMLSKE